MLSVVIPCYNEAETLPLTWSRLVAASLCWDEPCEFVFVDDGSGDGTWKVIQQLASQDTRVRGIRLGINQGQQWAIGVGLRAARGDAVVVLDADLQDPPELVAHMLSAWRSGADMVIAVRRQRQQEAWWKRLGAWLVYRGLWRLGTGRGLPDAGDFVLLDRRVVRWLLRWRMARPLWRGMREFGMFRRTYLEYDRPPRLTGQSHYSVRRLCRLAWDGLFGLTELPARMTIWLTGIVMILTLAGVLAIAFVKTSPAPWIAGIGLAILALLSGQLAILSLYAWRIVRSLEMPMDALLVDRTDEAMLQSAAARGKTKPQGTAKRL